MSRFTRFALFAATAAVTYLLSQTTASAVSPDAVAYRSNPAHSGQATMPDFVAPVVVKWDANLHGQVSYALIAGGQVFVIVSGSAPQLYALNAADGSIHWGPVTLPRMGEAAYDNGKVFVTMGQLGNAEAGLMLAYDAATGVLVWSTTYNGQWWSNEGPTALNGYVYTQEVGEVSRIRETDGTVMWTTPQLSTMDGDLAVTASGLYVSGACGQTYSLDPATGSIRWHFSTACEGGGGYTAAYYNSAVYIQDYYSGSFPDTEAAINASTGAFIRTLPNQGAPAFDNGLMFGVINNAVVATNLTTWANAWTGNNGIDLPVTAPTVINGIVYVGTSTGYLKG